MKRKIMIVSILAVFMLVAISYATAVTVEQTSETENESSISETYVDQEIYLTEDHLDVLYESLEYIDDEDILQLVQGIIDVIADKGYVNSEDIQAIQEELYIFLPIHTGVINSHGDGICHKFPGELLLWAFLPSPGIQPINAVYWDGENDLSRSGGTPYTSINLGLHTYEGNHQGLIIGFLGVCSVLLGMSGSWMEYSVMGMGLLIIVSPGAGCNMESNVQSQPNSQQSSPSSQQTVSTPSSSSSTSNN